MARSDELELDGIAHSGSKGAGAVLQTTLADHDGVNRRRGRSRQDDETRNVMHFAWREVLIYSTKREMRAESPSLNSGYLR